MVALVVVLIVAGGIVVVEAVPVVLTNVESLYFQCNLMKSNIQTYQNQAFFEK